MSEQTAPEPVVVGGYELARQVSVDTYGDTYVGHRNDDRDVVTLLSHHVVIDVVAARRFADEVTRIQDLMPMGVLPVTGFDFDTHPRWIATEFVTGQLLSQRIESAGPLSQNATRLLANQLARSLQALHARGIVQRDLSPNAVLLTQDGSRIWRTGWAGLVDGSEYAGTVHTEHVEWLAPEQVLGEASSPASDIHAWAVTVLFAATGHNPFAAQRAAESVTRLIRETPIIPPLFDPVLASLIAGALDKQPGARPTARDLLQFLDPGTPLLDENYGAAIGTTASEVALTAEPQVDHMAEIDEASTLDESIDDEPHDLGQTPSSEELDTVLDEDVSYFPAEETEGRVGYLTVTLLGVIVIAVGSVVGLLIGRVLGG